MGAAAEFVPGLRSLRLVLSPYKVGNGAQTFGEHLQEELSEFENSMRHCEEIESVCEEDGCQWSRRRRSEVSFFWRVKP